MSNQPGWFKKVFAEDQTGNHVELDALFYCRTEEEARKLAKRYTATHLRLGQEALIRESEEVYLSNSGRRFVIFDWRKQDSMMPLEVDSQY